MKAKNKDLSKKVLSIGVSVLIFLPTINYYISFILDYFGLPTSSYIIYPVLYIFSFLMICYSIKENKKTLIVLFAYIIAALVTIIIFPQNIKYFKGTWYDLIYHPVYRTVFLCVPLLISCIALKDISCLKDKFYILAKINIIVSLIAYFWIILYLKSEFEYMAFSYGMLFGSLTCLSISILDKKKIWTILALISIIISMLIGSRGEMLSVVLYIIIFALLFNLKLTPKKAVWIFLSLLAFIVLIVFFKQILTGVSNVLDELGFNSRTIDRLLNNTILQDNGRTDIFTSLFNAIKNNPFGYGLYGDRIFAELVNESYAHNIILELITQFGVFIGFIISLIYLLVSIWALFIRSNKNVRVIYYCLFASTFFKMMVTSTYLTEQIVWLMFGYACYIISRGKTNEDFYKKTYNSIIQD